jgi:hypothetical protein
MKTIYEFKKGDEITRIAPSKPFGEKRMSIFGETGGVRCRSYMGDKLIFVGIANGQIYCKRTDKLDLEIFGDKLISLPVDVYDDSWDYYIDPKILLEGYEHVIDKTPIEEQIKKAIENEDYELAERLKNKFK